MTDGRILIPGSKEWQLNLGLGLQDKVAHQGLTSVPVLGCCGCHFAACLYGCLRMLFAIACTHMLGINSVLRCNALRCWVLTAYAIVEAYRTGPSVICLLHQYEECVMNTMVLIRQHCKGP